MITKYNFLSPELPKLIQNGAVGIVPTDLHYGIIAHAQNPQAVERLYSIKKRDPAKISVVLVSTPEKVHDFGIPQEHVKLATRYWPGPVTVIFEGVGVQYDYLHHGLHSLAFRIPNHPTLRYFLERTGPVIAPNANKEGQTAIQSQFEAEIVYGDKIDFFIDGGKLSEPIPTIVHISAGGQVQESRPDVAPTPAGS
jgi:L-threonylcarbamoyladenylate synthase